MGKEDKNFIPDQQMITSLQEVQSFLQKQMRVCQLAEKKIEGQHQNYSSNLPKQIHEHKQIVQNTLNFINIAIANETKYYSAERTNIFYENLQPDLNRNYHPNAGGFYSEGLSDEIKALKEFHQNLDNQNYNPLSYVNFTTTPYFTRLRDNAEQLANARNEERYQPLQDIMDTIIIMLSKAASIHMPTVMIDAAIKVLGSIGGHLADIIKEDYTAMRSPDQLKEVQKDLEQRIKRLETTPPDKHLISTLTLHVISRFNEISETLGLPKSDKFATNDKFIDALETSVTQYLQNDQVINQRENKQPQIDIETLNKLYENALTEIQNYKKLINNNNEYLIEDAQKKLTQVQQQIKNLEKQSPRKSRMAMTEELKTKREQTHLEKVRKQNEQRSKSITK